MNLSGLLTTARIEMAAPPRVSPSSLVSTTPSKSRRSIELLGRIDCVLTGHRIDHEERFARFDGSLDGRDLLHHLFIYGQTSGRIDDYRVEVVRPGVLDRILGNLYRVLVSLFGVDLHADLLPQNL